MKGLRTGTTFGYIWVETCQAVTSQLLFERSSLQAALENRACPIRSGHVIAHTAIPTQKLGQAGAQIWAGGQTLKQEEPLACVNCRQ